MSFLLTLDENKNNKEKNTHKQQIHECKYPLVIELAVIVLVLCNFSMHELLSSLYESNTMLI